MKVPWPLAERELIVHYFLFEYFKDGLVVILLNTVKKINNLLVCVFHLSETFWHDLKTILVATF